MLGSVRALKRVLIPLLVIVLAFVVVPLVIPVPPLERTVPAEELADPDSRFVQVNGLQVHYKMQGAGAPALVLLHGFGASTFSFEAVMPSLAELGTIIAFDRPAFGLTERPTVAEWGDQNPYTIEAQSDLTVELLERFGLTEAVLVGHSAGGSVAVVTALRHPARVKALVLVGAAVYEGGTPGWLGPLLRTPRMRRLGPLIARRFARTGSELLVRAWHDPSRISPATAEGYEKPLRAQGWDKALWELVMASQPLELAERLREVRVPVLVLTGDSDRIVPPEQSARLAAELANARLVTIADCGHLPQEERPEEFLEAVAAFLEELQFPISTGGTKP